MSSIVKLALFLCGLVLVTALMAAGGSGWKAGFQAAKGFGLWLGGMLLIGLVVYLGMA